MEHLLKSVNIIVDEHTFVKDPSSSALGQMLVREGVDLMLELGLEGFTFKKLAEKVESTEGAVYRYFENKHKFFLYLYNWYWNYMDYRLRFSINNLNNPDDKLSRVVAILTDEDFDEQHQNLNLANLHALVIQEAPKAFLTKHVGKEYSQGVFKSFQNFVDIFANIISELNSDFKHPTALSISIIDSIYQQHYYRQHVPALTDLSANEAKDFFIRLIKKSIDK
jgi:AcrR family transcriptional regulator